MKLDFRHLEVLVAVDETGSLTAAAKRLRTSQPHLSRQLRLIEEHLGHPVFHRGIDGMRATASGLEVLARARRALDVVDDFTVRLPVETPLRILHSRIVASPFLVALRREHPQLCPELEFADHHEAHRRLRSGTAEVYLGIRLPHATWPPAGELVVQRVVADTMSVLLPASHRLAGRAEIRLADLAGEDWITTPMADARDMALGECRGVGGFEPRLRHVVQDSAQLTALVHDELGVTLASSTWAPPDGVIRRPYAGAGAAHWVVITAPGRVAPEVAVTITEVVRSRYEELRVRAVSGTAP